MYAEENQAARPAISINQGKRQHLPDIPPGRCKAGQARQADRRPNSIAFGKPTGHLNTAAWVDVSASDQNRLLALTEKVSFSPLHLSRSIFRNRSFERVFATKQSGLAVPVFSIIGIADASVAIVHPGAQGLGDRNRAYCFSMAPARRSALQVTGAQRRRQRLTSDLTRAAQRQFACQKVSCGRLNSFLAATGSGTF